ncbi:MAG: hypothetical protein NXI30_03695 [bacterium]|nr:hypothetical protein [bacterium]
MSDSISDVLQTSAEVAVAFVGFASLIGVFYARTEGRLPESVRLSLRSLLDYGLIALVACGMPLLLRETALPATTIWRLSSGLMAVLVAGYMMISQIYYKEVSELARASSKTRSATIAFLVVGDGIAILVLALNAAGWPFDVLPAIYLAGAVFWNVCGAAVSFRGVIDLAWSEGDG